VASKCKDINDTLLGLEEEIQNLDMYIDEVRDQTADPTITPRHEQFDQAVKSKAQTIKNRKTRMDNPNDVMKDSDINTIVNKQFKNIKIEGGTETERVTLVHQLSTLMNNDSDFNATANEVIRDKIKSLPFEELREAGIPIVFDQLSGNPNLYTVPLRSIRIIYSELAPYMDVDEDGKARGLIDSALAFEFYLPKNVLKSAATATAIKFKHSLYRWRNKVNAYVASYSGPINIDPRLEKELTHPETGLPMINQLRRSKAGYKDIFNILSTSLYRRLRVGRNQDGISQISNHKEMFQVITDLMQGKAFIIDSGPDFGKVFMFDKELPRGAWESTGDVKHAWSGYEFTEAEKAEIEKKTGKDFNQSHYVVPYMTNKTKKNKDGVHLNLNEKLAGDQGENLAGLVDSTLIHLSNILTEVGSDSQDALFETQEKWQKLMAEFKERGIEMPKEVFGDYVQLNEDIIAMESQVGKIKGSVQYRKQVTKKDGETIEVTLYRRYYPTLYYSHSIGAALNSGIENIDIELSGLRFRSLPNPQATPEQQKIIDSAIDRRIELTKAKRHLEMSLERFKDSDNILDEEDKTPVALRPFFKHFKAVSHFIPYKYRRNDEGVVEAYVNRVSRVIVKTEVLMDMLDVYKDVDSPSYRNYLVNQYRKAFGDRNAEGSFGGIRFTMEELSKFIPGLSGESLAKFFKFLRAASVFNNLSSMTTGIANMAAHVNKIFEVGANQFSDAYAESFIEENQRSIIKSGILSFQDVIENHIMINGNQDEKISYKLQEKKWKKVLKEGGSISDKQKAIDILSLMKKNHNPIMHNVRGLANWAISGEISINRDDPEKLKLFKKVINLKKHISMSKSEKSVRATSYQMGVNKAQEGWGVDADDPIAVDMGIRFVEELDFSLGPEGVGDMFGNEIMQWLMHIRVWSVQRMSYGKDAMQNAFKSVRPYPNEKKFVDSFKGNSKASWEFVKALTTTMMGSGLSMSAPIVAGLAGGVSGGVLGGIGGAVAGYAGSEVVQKITGAKERQKALRFQNADMAKATQMFLFHGTFALMYDFIIFNANLNFGVYAGMVALVKKIGWRTSAHKFGPSFAAPELRFAFMSIAMLFKGLKDDDELEKHDLVKLVGSVGGIGYMQIMYLFMSFFDDQNAIIKGSYEKKKDYHRSLMDLNYPKAIKDFGIEATHITGGIKDLKRWWELNQPLSQ
tara:strand:+ start:18113 stop:21691 length:3579 start_codon:yes stop_codon:yes gene_type:complete